MSALCPSRERLSAGASGEDGEVIDHAAACEACGAELDAMAWVIAAARRAPAGPSLEVDRRASLRAAVLAMSDDVGGAAWGGRRGRWPWAFAAAAAAIVIAIGVASMMRGRAAALLAAPTPPPATATIAASSSIASHEAPAPAATAAAPAPGPAPITRLADGATTFDTRAGAPVQIALGDTRVEIARAKVEITARGGAIATVRVFAGSAEISHDGERVVVASGELWSAPTAPAALPAPSASWRAFETGWTALRAARYADAIAAFDQASDPAVAEDAAYWAAIAALRAGDRADAARRLRAFATAFPSSARADDARAALARLAP